MTIDHSNYILLVRPGSRYDAGAVSITQQKPSYEMVNTAPVLLGMNGTVLPVLALVKSHFR